MAKKDEAPQVEQAEDEVLEKEEEARQTAPEESDSNLEDEYDDSGDDTDFDETDLTFLQPKEEREAALKAAEGEEEKEKKAAAEPSAEEAPKPEETKAEAKPEPQPTAEPAAQQPTDEEAGRKAAEEAERVTLEKMESFFSLSEEEKEAVNLDAASIMPKLAARVMLRTVQTAVAAIQHQLPTVIAQYQESQTTQQSAMDAFYTSWPQLRESADAQPLISQYANLYRMQNPKATQEEAIKAVGASVMVALGLAQQPTGQPTPAPESATPGGNGQRTVRRESLPPHRPAASTPPRALGPSQPSNTFEAMALEDD